MGDKCYTLFEIPVARRSEHFLYKYGVLKLRLALARCDLQPSQTRCVPILEPSSIESVIEDLLLTSTPPRNGLVALMHLPNRATSNSRPLPNLRTVLSVRVVHINASIDVLSRAQGHQSFGRHVAESVGVGEIRAPGFGVLA